MPKKIAIIGGGISGLCVALKLADKHKVHLFEKCSQFGGLAKSVRKGNYIFDIGPHAFHTNNPNTLENFKKIMDNEIVSFEKRVMIDYKGRYYKYPLKPFDVLLRMNPFYSLWCILNLLYVKTKYKFVKSKDRSADEWLSNRFGKPLYELFFKGYTTKVWGVPPKKLSALFAQHRIPTINFRDMIFRGILNIKKSFDEGHKFAPQVFKAYYPKKKGVGYFAEKLVNKNKKKGVKLHKNSEVTKINVKNNRAHSIELKQNNKIIKFHADILISTIPIDDFVRKLKTSQQIKNALKYLDYRSLLVICIVVNKDSIFKVLHFYFRDKFFHRLSELKNFNKQLFPKGKTGLIAEITCDYNDGLWKMNDKKIFENTVKDLEKEKFVKMSDVEDFFVLRIKNAYPRYGIGFAKALNDIYTKLKKISNLYSIGRQGMFRYIDMDLCMKNAFDVASEINSGKNKKVYNEFNIEKTPYI